MGLSNSAIIVIVLVCSLASVSLAAALFGAFVAPQANYLWSPTSEQHIYMRKVRSRYLRAIMEENGIRYPVIGSR
jgi:hypothetical protein